MKIKARERCFDYRAGVLVSMYALNHLEARELKAGKVISVEDDIAQPLVDAGLVTIDFTKPEKKKQSEGSK